MSSSQVDQFISDQERNDRRPILHISSNRNRNASSYAIFECLFIFSVSKLLLNAASYDGEIWHADAWQPRPGLLLVFSRPY